MLTANTSNTNWLDNSFYVGGRHLIIWGTYPRVVHFEVWPTGKREKGLLLRIDKIGVTLA